MYNLTFLSKIPKPFPRPYHDMNKARPNHKTKMQVLQMWLIANQVKTKPNQIKQN